MTKAIFDSHSHYMPPQVAEKTAFFKNYWSDIERQLSVMDECGIEKSLLLYPNSDAHLNMGGWKKVCAVYNHAISGLIKKYSDRFIGAGILPMDSPDDFFEELKRIKDLGLKVVCLPSSYEGKFLDEKIFDGVYEFSKNNKMPIFIHPQIINPIGEDRIKDSLLTPVLEYVFDISMCIGKMMMEETFFKFYDVKFIFAHFGGVLPFLKERFDNTYMMLRKRNFVKDLKNLPSQYFKNLFFETSGSRSPAMLLAALEITDASHILFGSDFPANQDVSSSIQAIEKADLSDGDKRLILKNNLLKILDLK